MIFTCAGNTGLSGMYSCPAREQAGSHGWHGSSEKPLHALGVFRGYFFYSDSGEIPAGWLRMGLKANAGRCLSG